MLWCADQIESNRMPHWGRTAASSSCGVRRHAACRAPAGRVVAASPPPGPWRFIGISQLFYFLCKQFYHLDLAELAAIVQAKGSMNKAQLDQAKQFVSGESPAGIPGLQGQAMTSGNIAPVMPRTPTVLEQLYQKRQQIREQLEERSQ